MVAIDGTAETSVFFFVENNGQRPNRPEINFNNRETRRLKVAGDKECRLSYKGDECEVQNRLTVSETCHTVQCIPYDGGGDASDEDDDDDYVGRSDVNRK